MTIPVYVLGAISLVIQVYYSDKLKRRGVFIVGCCVPVAVGYLMCVGSAKGGVGYAGMFVLVIGKPCRYSATESLNDVSTRAIPHLNAGSNVDFYQSVARFQTCDRNAASLFDC